MQASRSIIADALRDHRWGGPPEARRRRIQTGDVMTPPTLCLPPDADLPAAVQLMREHRIGRLPVAGQGHLVGT